MTPADLRAFRTAHGWSQRGLAQRLGQGLTNDTGNLIGRTTGRKVHHHPQRFAGPGLCPGSGSRAHTQQAEQHQTTHACENLHGKLLQSQQ